MSYSNILMRCSSLGLLMTEPVSKADKDAGVLSKTAQSHLISVYIREKYGRIKEVETKQMRKGKEAEEDSIDLLSKYLGRYLQKNTERIDNDFVTGLPDIFEGDKIIGCDFIWDIKTCWDIFTFMDKLTSPLDKNYWWQLQGYMYLTGAKKSAIAYCLTDTPEYLIASEKRKLMYQMDVATEESPEFQEAAAGLELNLIYPDIPTKEKVLIFNVDRDDDAIFRISQKVERARLWLQEFEQKHINFNA